MLNMTKSLETNHDFFYFSSKVSEYCSLKDYDIKTILVVSTIFSCSAPTIIDVIK
jgi:hypothetical protein